GIAQKNEEKAQLLYDMIDNSNLFYAPIEKASRSLMNVVFRVKGDDEALEAQCIADATESGLSGLKGHRSAGGLRASIYNAQLVEGVQALADFLQAFEQKHG
ncbi:MAG: 3-phosphoserine/phosphohydroxythreonine transaminase, partial [Chloroflexota bacterium]